MTALANRFTRNGLAVPLAPRTARLVVLVSMGSGALIAFLLGAGFVPASFPIGFDAAAYWSAHLPQPYTDAAYASAQVFFYSPAAAQVLALVNWLPWIGFLAVWAALQAGALVYVARAWTLPLLLVPVVVIELLMGNIHLLMAAAIVAGFRYPATWSFLLLTKVTPGIGLLWFAVRREWRSFGIALGATALIAGISFVLAPSLWLDWIRVLAGNAGQPVPNAWPVPFLLRLPIAGVLVIYGALTDRRWLVPIASFLAIPAIWGHSFAVLVAVIPLLGTRRPGAQAGIATVRAIS